MKYNILLITERTIASETLDNFIPNGDICYSLITDVTIVNLLTDVLPYLRDQQLINQIDIRFDILNADNNSLEYSSKTSPYSDLVHLYRDYLTNQTKDFDLSEDFMDKVISNIPQHIKSTEIKFLFDTFDYGFDGDGYKYRFTKFNHSDNSILLTADGLDDIKLSIYSEDIEIYDIILLVKAIALQNILDQLK